MGRGGGRVEDSDGDGSDGGSDSGRGDDRA